MVPHCLYEAQLGDLFPKTSDLCNTSLSTANTPFEHGCPPMAPEQAIHQKRPGIVQVLLGEAGV